MPHHPATQTISTSSAQCECAVFGRGAKPLVILPGIFTKSLMPFAQGVADRYQKFLDGYKSYLLDRPLNPPETCGADFLAQAAALTVGRACAGDTASRHAL